MVDAWDLAAVEQAFAEAAVDPALWTRALEVAAEATQGVGALLFPHPGVGRHGSIPIVPHTPSLAGAHETYIADGWSQRDERERAWPRLLDKRVVTDFDDMGADEMKRHPYYQEFLAPRRFQWFAGVLVSSGEDNWALSIQRSITQSPFDDGEKVQLDRLSRRLGGAAALARALGFVAIDAALEAYEISGLGVAVIGLSGEVIRLNAAGERLIGQGIAMHNRHLVGQSPDATRALERALHKLIFMDSSNALMPPVSLPRHGRMPLLAYPVKLSRLAGNLFFDGQVLLVFIDPQTRGRPPEGTLRKVWGLTPAEAKLASNLAAGDGLETVADQLRIASSTARKQLSNIFAKTGTHRQGELIAMLLAVLGNFF